MDHSPLPFLFGINFVTTILQLVGIRFPRQLTSQCALQIICLQFYKIPYLNKMHVRIRILGKTDTVVVVESKLTKIQHFRRVIKEKFHIEPKLQRLFYGGKLLEDGYTFHDYNIKLNDVIQLMVQHRSTDNLNEELTHSRESSTNCNNEVTNATNSIKYENGVNKLAVKEINYKDAVSNLYAVEDLIDVRDKEQGAWHEAKIVRIVHKLSNVPDKESDSENRPPSDDSEEEISSKKKVKGIAEYFNKMAKRKKQQVKNKKKGFRNEIVEEDLLFKIQLDDEDEATDWYCEVKEIRPRARNTLDIADLKPGQTVMINHNCDEPLEKGFWYDFKIDEVKSFRTYHELIGTLYSGPCGIIEEFIKARIHDKVFSIEMPVPIAERTEQHRMMNIPPEKRTRAVICTTCRDVEEMPCKDCGCFLCRGKEDPHKIVLCDECNKGFHMMCLKPPLAELPEDDWYCPSCKRDPNEVVAPGAAKQIKKTTPSKTKRDWGRGMACVGKTKTCSMPANHFGPIPGIEVGMCWRFRIQLSETGVHRPPVSGIHGRDVEGAYSIVLSGGYEDDVDHGNEFTYTGSGGRDLSGNKRTAEQSCDQTLTRENKALARNCAVKTVTEEGGDAGDNWRSGKPVRVVRSYKMLKHFPKYAPKEGIRYDGIYKVVKYYPEKGLSGFRVWKYLLRRDDPSPAPWEPGAKSYPIVYPDGYLEAEAEKKALKEKNSKTGKTYKKRTFRETSISSDSDDETMTPVKRRKLTRIAKNGASSKRSRETSDCPKITITHLLNDKTNSKKESLQAVMKAEEMAAIKADTLNSKLWKECILVCDVRGKKDFIEYVTQIFLCIICQDVVANPVTTPCSHNFCLVCIKLAFKSTGDKRCSYCRKDLSQYNIESNDRLKLALQTILPGYDAGRM